MGSASPLSLVGQVARERALGQLRDDLAAAEVVTRLVGSALLRCELLSLDFYDRPRKDAHLVVWRALERLRDDHRLTIVRASQDLREVLIMLRTGEEYVVHTPPNIS